MTDKECTEIYYKWKHYMSGQILIDGIWEDIIDIRKNFHIGWLCKTPKRSIKLLSIKLCNIKFPS